MGTQREEQGMERQTEGHTAGGLSSSAQREEGTHGQRVVSRRLLLHRFHVVLPLFTAFIASVTLHEKGPQIWRAEEGNRKISEESEQL